MTRHETYVSSLLLILQRPLIGYKEKNIKDKHLVLYHLKYWVSKILCVDEENMCFLEYLTDMLLCFFLNIYCCKFGLGMPNVHKK